MPHTQAYVESSDKRGVILHLIEGRTLHGRVIGPAHETVELARASIRLLNHTRHVVCLLGDCEMNPPVNHNAIASHMFACEVRTLGLPLAHPILARSTVARLIRNLHAGQHHASEHQSGNDSRHIVIQTYTPSMARLARSLGRLTTGEVLIRLDRDLPLALRIVGSVRPRSNRASRERLAPFPALEDRSSDREPLRASLGIDADVCVLTLLEGKQNVTDARWFVFLGGIMVAAGMRVAVIVPRSAAHVARARRFHATTRLSLRVIVAERNTDALLPACDAALWNDPLPRWRDQRHEPGVLAPIALAHASGIPVIMPISHAPLALYPEWTRELCLTPSGQIRHFARLLAAMMTQRDRKERIQAAIRAHINQLGDDRRFSDALHDSHRLLAVEQGLASTIA